jgi:hypothetical protein
MRDLSFTISLRKMPRHLKNCTAPWFHIWYLNGHVNTALWCNTTGNSPFCGVEQDMAILQKLDYNSFLDMQFQI